MLTSWKVSGLQRWLGNHVSHPILHAGPVLQLIFRVFGTADHPEKHPASEVEDRPTPHPENCYAASASPITPQVQSFAMPKDPKLSCQIRQTSDSEETLCRLMRASFGSGQWRPIAPTRSMLSETPASTEVKYVGNPDGIFAKGQFLPLSFYVLGGSMQKLAEADISVCHTYGVVNEADCRISGVVPLSLFTEPILWWYRNSAYESHRQGSSDNYWRRQTQTESWLARTGSLLVCHRVV